MQERCVKRPRIESARVAVRARGRGEDIVRRTPAHRRLLVFAVAVFASAAFLAAAGVASARVAGFRWFRAAAAPAAWSHGALAPGAGTLFYPATFVNGHDKDGLARERLDHHGTVLVYLDLTRKQGAEHLSNWPSYRLGLVRAESNDVHEDGHAFGLQFRGGRGSCVVDDYRTRVQNHHYREIACFVQGRRHATVLIAAALESAWVRATKTLEQAVDAYRVY
jgi:hypothetical protein